MISEAPLSPALYLVGTPIGHLEDITLRALAVLRSADVIACEDTRQTQKLLNRYGIRKRTISYHEHNEATRAAELVHELGQSRSIALVTDAGMPAISDPGCRLISLAIRQGIPVIPIPGASAFLAALVASGLPTDSFRFRGFLPARQSERRKTLESLKNSGETEIFYEAPHRIREALRDVAMLLGAERQVVIAREVTKVHEEFLRGTSAELLQQAEGRGEWKGEITLLIGKNPPQETSSNPPQSIPARLGEVMATSGLDERAALKLVARERGISKSQAYREWQQRKQGK